MAGYSYHRLASTPRVRGQAAVRPEVPGHQGYRRGQARAEAGSIVLLAEVHRAGTQEQHKRAENPLVSRPKTSEQPVLFWAPFRYKRGRRCCRAPFESDSRFNHPQVGALYRAIATKRRKEPLASALAGSASLSRRADANSPTAMPSRMSFGTSTLIFRSAILVETQMGGTGGGGARLTKLGRDVVGRYRAIEGAATTASAADLRALKASLPSKPLLRDDP